MSLYVVYGAVRVPEKLVNFLLNHLPKPQDVKIGEPMPLYADELDRSDMELYVVYGRIPLDLVTSREAKEGEVSMGLVLYQGQRESYILQGAQRMQLLQGSIFRVADVDSWEVEVNQNDMNPMIYVLFSTTLDDEMAPHAFGAMVMEKLADEIDVEGIEEREREELEEKRKNDSRKSRDPEKSAAEKAEERKRQNEHEPTASRTQPVGAGPASSKPSAAAAKTPVSQGMTAKQTKTP